MCFNASASGYGRNVEMCRWSSVGRSIRLREGMAGVSWSDDESIVCVLFVCEVGSVIWM